MKQILLMIAVIAVVALVGCGKKPAEESVFDQGRPDATKPSKPPAKTGAQIEPEIKAFAETKAKAEAGVATAQFNLGVMYGKGQGVEQDFKEAVKWYQKAADQGDAGAQYALGHLYYNGMGVKEDRVTAYALCLIASANGNGLASVYWKPKLDKQMTSEQVAEAEALVKEMVKKNPKLLNK